MADRSVREFSTQAPAGYIGDFLQGGIFPYAQGFLQDQFQNLGTPDSSPYTYTGQRVADFDPRERYAMDMSDQAIGSYRPYLQNQGQLLSEAGTAARGGTTEGQGLIRSGLGAGADFTREAAGIARGSAPDFGSARAGLGRAEQTGIGSTGMYDPNSAQGFYNPYEQQVVDQTMRDVREGLAKGDMGMRDEAVSGGAFGGSRSRMRRDELAANTARGAAQQVGALRSQGFGQAQNQAQQAFEAQQARRAGFAGQQAGLAGQRGTLAGAEGQAALARSGQLGGFGQQAYGMSTGAGQGIAGLGTGLGQNLAGYGQATGAMGQQLAGLQGADINRTMGMGGLNRGRTQSEMDLAYQNFTGQYNLPMQTLQNVGSLTASLAPIAGGYGYAGQGVPTEFAGGSAYVPNTGGIGSMYSSVGTGAGAGAGAGGNPTTVNPFIGMNQQPGAGQV